MAVSLRQIDEYLLDRLGSLAARVQTWTGYDALHLSNALWVVYLVSSSVGAKLAGDLRIVSVVLLCAAINIGGNYASAPGIRRGSLLGLRNPRRALWPPRWVLTFFFTWVAAATTHPPFGRAYYVTGNAALVAATWLGCCDILPPAAGKIRKWLRSLLNARSPQPVGQEG